MDVGYQLRYKNVVLIFAILFAVVMVVQHFELPYDGSELLSSLLSPKDSYNKERNFPVGGESSSDIVLERNQSLKGDRGLVSSNQTSFKKIIENSMGLKDDRNSVCNEKLEKDVAEIRVSKRGSLYSSTGSSDSCHDWSPVSPAIPPSDSNLSTPVKSSDHNTYSRPIDATYSSSRDVKPTPFKGTFTGSTNESDLADFSAVKKINNNATMLVMPISKMNEFLHQSYSSPLSHVCTRIFPCFSVVSDCESEN